MSRMTRALWTVLVVLALSPAAANATPSLHHVHWHIDAYGGWGSCLEADSQHAHSTCIGTGQHTEASAPFTGPVAFNWTRPGDHRCPQNAATKAAGFDKQVVISLAGENTSHWTDGMLCGYTNREMSSPALIIPPGAKIKLHGHWVWPRTGGDPHQAGHRGGPLHINLIHRTEGAFNHIYAYTLIVQGYLEY